MVTADGLYKITGRLSRFIKIFGNRIGLEDVERILEEDGHHAIATGVDDQLLIVMRNTQAGTAIVVLLNDRLKLPAGYVVVRVVEEYPLLASGKIDYAILKASLSAAPPNAPVANPARGWLPWQAPRSSTPLGVQETFVAAFGEAARNEGASFNSLGGDSLNYVKTAIGLEESIPDLPEDWASMSIGALAELADTRRDVNTPRVELKRLAKIDTLRGLACMLVVSFHYVGMTANDGMRLPQDSGWHYFLNSFVMLRLPLFTAVAGFLYGAMPVGRDGFNTFMLRKVRKLLVPMVFCDPRLLALAKISRRR